MAGARSFYSAGWRPAIGWICTVGVAVQFIVNPILQWATGSEGPAMPISSMTELVIAMLGLGTLRTVEKLSGKVQ